MKNYKVQFSTLKDFLDYDTVLEILSELGVEPVRESADFAVFPTYCHNPLTAEASNKLYLYKNTLLFHCMTECLGTFDVIEFYTKIKQLNGDPLWNERKSGEAIKKYLNGELLETFEHFTLDLLEKRRPVNEYSKLYPVRELSKFTYSKDFLDLFLRDNISEDTLSHFHIGYSFLDKRITIPCFNSKGELVGIRGRAIEEDNPNKYMPVRGVEGPMSFPVSLFLYGEYENGAEIMRQGTAVLFEGEKSVMKLHPYYQLGLATYGNKISNEQIKKMIKMGVSNLVLAFDKDWKTLREKQLYHDKVLTPLVNKLKPFFNVFILEDPTGEYLGYKESPIDRGIEVFEALYGQMTGRK